MKQTERTEPMPEETRAAGSWPARFVLWLLPLRFTKAMANWPVQTVLMLLAFAAVLPVLVMILHSSFVGRTEPVALFLDLVVVAVAAVMGFFVAAYIGMVAIVRPIGKLVQAAQKLGVGDFESRVGQIGGIREIQELGRAFDEMASLLASRNARQRQVEQALRESEARSRALLEQSIMDVSERQTALAALRRSEERYRLIFNGISDAAFVHENFDGDTLPGKFVEVNDVACRRLGYSREELLQMRPTDIDAPETVAGLPAQMNRAFTEGSAIWEGAHVTKDGRHIPVEISTSLFELDGKKMAFSAVRDISERARAAAERSSLEEQLRQSQKMEAVGRLAGGVAHDFNNLLMAMLGYTELLLTDPKVPASIRDDLREIQRAGERAAMLTRQLLAFSRKQVIAPVVLSLGDVVRESEKMIRRIVGEDIAFTCVVDARCGFVKADPGQIEQIVMNLVVNSRDAMPRGGVLTMETREVTFDEAYVRTHPEAHAGRWAMLAISDTGSGMTPDTMSHIFEPFYTTKAAGKGTGLGLPTVYGIVKQNEGFIQVHSELSAGTAVKIYFPIIDRKLSASETRAKQSAVPRGTETVLLVEDETLVRQLTRTMLERLGYQVIEAASGNEALANCRGDLGKIDLLFTDIVMPGMNGRELQEAICRLHPGLKTLFVSGYTDDVVAVHGILEAGVHFLAKPFSSGELARKVRQVLDE